MALRIGQGFDVHAFCSGDHIVLGGISIPYKFSLKAHSDGDVLLHAICDALLGAAALGDIGLHFPDNDAAYEGADSRQLLRQVVGLLRENDYSVTNSDATIIAQAPKMAPYIQQMRANIAEDCGLPVNAVSVKATTTEHLGFIGREQGIACQAVVLLASL